MFVYKNTCNLLCHYYTLFVYKCKYFYVLIFVIVIYEVWNIKWNYDTTYKINVNEKFFIGDLITINGDFFWLNEINDE